MGQATVVNGYLIPDRDDVKAVLQQLQADMKNDARLAAEYRLNPRQVLGSRGLALDVQNEWIDENDAQAGCVSTCVCTGCCITNIG